MRRRLAAQEPALAARLAGANDRLETALVGIQTGDPFAPDFLRRRPRRRDVVKL